MKQIEREQQFITYWQHVAVPDPPGMAMPVLQHRFHPKRKWRMDFAWPDVRVAVEIEGGTFGGRSRHTTGTGHHADCDKYNQAALCGWLVLRFTSLHLEREPMQMIELIVEAITKRKEGEL